MGFWVVCFQKNGDATHELENIRKGPDFQRKRKMMKSAGLCAYKMPWRRPNGDTLETQNI